MFWTSPSILLPVLASWRSIASLYFLSQCSSSHFIPAEWIDQTGVPGLLWKLPLLSYISSVNQSFVIWSQAIADSILPALSSVWFHTPLWARELRQVCEPSNELKWADWLHSGFTHSDSLSYVLVSECGLETERVLHWSFLLASAIQFLSKQLVLFPQQHILQSSLVSVSILGINGWLHSICRVSIRDQWLFQPSSTFSGLSSSWSRVPFWKMLHEPLKVLLLLALAGPGIQSFQMPRWPLSQMNCSVNGISQTEPSTRWVPRKLSNLLRVAWIRSSSLLSLRWLWLLTHLFSSLSRPTSS